MMAWMQRIKKILIVHKKYIIIAFATIILGASLFIMTKIWLDSRNQAEYEAAAKTLEEGNYKGAYTQLKAVDARGGTTEKNGSQSYTYYLALARTAYLAGDSKGAKQYAEKGIAQLPPEDSEAYFTAQMDAYDLLMLSTGDYRDSYEYQTEKPPVGSGEAQ